MLTATEFDRVIERIKQLVQDGRVIEAGWTAMSAHVLDDCSASERDTLRLFYFGGAQHVFSMLASVLKEPHDDDDDAVAARRIEQITRELELFVKANNDRAEQMAVRH